MARLGCVADSAQLVAPDCTDNPCLRNMGKKGWSFLMSGTLKYEEINKTVRLVLLPGEA